MSPNTLFLLKHDFPDGPGQPFYCPECAQINGVLHYYPQLRHVLEVRYVDFPRPRPDVVALVGEANQSCPVLVLGEAAGKAPDGVTVREHAGRRFVSGAKDIGNYLAAVYGSGRPH
jgi:hypothetical protein